MKSPDAEQLPSLLPTHTYTHTNLQGRGKKDEMWFCTKKVIKEAGKFFFLVSFAYCGINKK